MRRILSVVVACALFGACVASIPARSAAHPHAWIDVTVQVLFDEAGRVAGLRERWLFDEYYTTFALEGIRDSGKSAQDDIDALAGGIMKNLRDYAYFTSVEHEGDGVAVAAVTETSSALRGQRLDMSFVLPFETPLDLKDAPLVYAIFDPTYYVEMLHADTEDAIRLDAAPAGCTYRLIEPEPSMETVALAAALDRTLSAGDGLGRHFAERVEVRCP